VSPAPTVNPVACATAPATVERTTGLLVEYLGADPSDPELCLSRRGGKPFPAWFGVWATEWWGAGDARIALRTVLYGPPGTVARFDTNAGPGLRWHETLINEGVEDIPLLGRRYRTQRIAHEREGFDGNTYHSVVTQWREIDSGMVVYQNYRHISGRPELVQWDPARIVEPRPR
jgi:hypothetical protein